MKNLIFIIALTAATNILFAQQLKDKDIPKIVKEKIKNLYPNISTVKWEKENGMYEAEFENNKIETSLLIDAEGKLFETETEIEINALPENIKVSVTRNYPEKIIKEASKIIDSNSEIFYEVEIDNKDLVFNEAGRLIKQAENVDEKELD